MPYEGSHAFPEEKTLAELQDRWTRHVSLCKQCKEVQLSLHTRGQNVTAPSVTGCVPVKFAASLAAMPTTLDAYPQSSKVNGMLVRSADAQRYVFRVIL